MAGSGGGRSSGLGLPRSTLRLRRNQWVRGPVPGRRPRGAAKRPCSAWAATAHDAAAWAESGACGGDKSADARAAASPQNDLGGGSVLPQRPGCDASLELRAGDAGGRGAGARRQLRIRFRGCRPRGRAKTSAETRKGSSEVRGLPSGPPLLRVPPKILSG